VVRSAAAHHHHGGARLAALLSGDLDLAEQVPYDSVER